MSKHPACAEGRFACFLPLSWFVQAGEPGVWQQLAQMLLNADADGDISLEGDLKHLVELLRQ